MQLNLQTRRQTSQRAFSLMEMLFAVALLSLITSAAFVVVSGLRESTLRQNLSRDVATLNNAVRVYEANGGNLEGVKEFDEVLGQLKKTSSNAESIAGIRGSFVDSRLDWETVSTDGIRRAVWEPSERRFVFKNSGKGVTKFHLNDKLGGVNYGSEERNVAFKLATSDGWVWDYLSNPKETEIEAPEDFDLDAGMEFSAVPLEGGPLQPPVFSMSGGEYAKTDFNLQVYLTNPNPSGSSTIRYTVSGGSWQIYDGTAIDVSPDTSIEAYSSGNSPMWQDSAQVFEVYREVSDNMDVAIAFSKPAYTFKELGGSMVGVTGTSHLAPPGVLQVFTDSQIALAPQDDDDDGGSGSSIVAVAYIGGREVNDLNLVNGQAILEVTEADFGTESSLWIGAKAASTIDPTVAAKAEHVIHVAPETLITPEVVERERPDGQQVYGEHFVEIVLDTASGQIPAGAEIYYTTDGTDPGDVSGAPTAAGIKTYTGPFLVAQPEGVPIRARVYGPDGKKQWFQTSSGGEIVWPLLNEVEFTVEVSETPPGGGESQSSNP